MHKKAYYLCICLAALCPLLLSSATLCAQAPKKAHVGVALCDNICQRIAPVPHALGNGSKPQSNLYCGAAYGLKTLMPKQQGWELIHSNTQLNEPILERIVLRNEQLNITVLADAYRGKNIQQAVKDFLDYCAGDKKLMVNYGAGTVQAGGGAGLIVFIGHNGLMDFKLDTFPARKDSKKRQAAIFACQSKKYFAEALELGGAEPLIWTLGNMAPEAYSLHALLEAWGRDEKPEDIRQQVALAYNKYQNCGIKGALWLFKSGY